MNEFAYVIFLENAKPLSREAVEQHVSHLRALDDAGKLALCGPFADYPGGTWWQFAPPPWRKYAPPRKNAPSLRAVFAPTLSAH